MKKNLLLILLLAMLPFCTSSKIQSGKSDVITNIDDNVREYFRGSYRIELNTDSTYCFCLSISKESRGDNSFLIYDIKNKEIIFQDGKPACKVKWINNKEILVTWEPEIIKGNENNSFSYVYNVKKKIKKTSDQMIVE